MTARQQPPAAANGDVPQVDESGGGSKWRAVVAVGWLWAFLIFFYSLTPPNNPDLPRYTIWPAVPFELLDVVDPPKDPTRALSGWSYFPQRLDLILTAAVILAGAWGAGHLCLRLIRPSLEARSAERTVFALGLGLSALSLLTLLFGLAGLLVRGLFAAMIAAALVAECGMRFRDRRRLVPTQQTNAQSAKGCDERPVSKRFQGLLILTITPFLLAMFLGSMLPPTDFDVREYHLEGPKEYFQAGRVTFLPHNVYTSFPSLTEMLSLLAMVLRGDWYRGALAGKAVLMCFGPLTGLALYSAGRRWFSPAAGWLAALVYLTMPWAFRISVIAYAEGGLTFYLFASLLAFAVAVPKFCGQDSSAARMILLCGLLAGSAMACKYTGLVSVVMPLLTATVVAPFLLRDSGGSRSGPMREVPRRLRVSGALRPATVFLVGVAITVGPWLLKNLVETGNPVYPLMYSIFDGADWDAELNAKWRSAHSPPGYSDLPARVLEVTAGNDWLSPLLFGLAPLSLLSVTRRRFGRYVWLYVLWLFATWWALTHRIDRFWVPMTPVIALLAGMGAVSVSGRAWRVAAGIGIGAAVLFNLTLVTSGESGYDAFLVDLDYSREWTQRELTPGIAFLNDNLPAGSRVLMVGEAQVFDARFPLAYNTVFDRSIFEEWCAEQSPGMPAGELPLRDAAAIQGRFRDEGITHLFVNWREIVRYRTTYGYTDFVTPERFDELQRRGVLGERSVLGVAEVGRLPKGDRQEIEAWAPSLVMVVNGRRVFITSALYAVRQ